MGQCLCLDHGATQNIGVADALTEAGCTRVERNGGATGGDQAGGGSPGESSLRRPRVMGMRDEEGYCRREICVTLLRNSNVEWT